MADGAHTDYKEHHASAKAVSWVTRVCDGGRLYICVWGGGEGFWGQGGLQGVGGDGRGGEGIRGMWYLGNGMLGPVVT